MWRNDVQLHSNSVQMVTCVLTVRNVERDNME
jgi:hypothetical protein